MEGEWGGIGTTDFWRVGSKAGTFNSGATGKIVSDMTRALNTFNRNTEIQI